MLNENTVLEIRKKRLLGAKHADLAIEYQLPLCIIRAILYRHHRKYAKGSDAPKAKLTEDNVKTIRELIIEGLRLKQIAAHFTVSISTVSDIKTGRSWQHLP